MGLFKFLFGHNSEPSSSEKKVDPVSETKRGYISDGGLYPDELAMLALAEKFEIEETAYPDYLRSKYFIGFPSSTLNSLYSRGFLRISTPAESLPTLKLADLKKIASAHGLKVSGTKDDLCNRISSIDESEYAGEIRNKYWKLTEKGRDELAASPYITYMTANHAYCLENFDINIVNVNLTVHNLPKYNIRDVIWSKLNEAKLIVYKKAYNERNFQHYADLLSTIASFLEEESRYKNALNSYLDYIFYRENFVAGANGIILASFKSDHSSDFYFYAKLMPYELEMLSELTEKIGLDENALIDAMKNNFSSQTDSGAFSNKQLIEFVLAEMSGRKSDAQAICTTVEKNIKRIVKKSNY